MLYAVDVLFHSVPLRALFERRARRPERFLYLHNCPPEFFDDLRHNGISEGSNSVHPAGNPMSHSTNSGFNWPPAASDSSSPP